MRLVRREAGEPDVGVEIVFEIGERAVLVGIDDDTVGVDALGLHIDGDGDDGGDADQEVRPLNGAV